MPRQPKPKRTKSKQVPAWKGRLEEILRDVPGFDPWQLAGDAWLDHDAAAAAINWFAENLKHVEGSARGEEFELRRWQAAIVGNIFGWKRRDDAGRIVRRFRQAFIFVPRGNGKTPLAAGIVAYGFFNDAEPGAQCFLAAGQTEQAGLLFRNLSGMIDQAPALADAVKIYRGNQHRSIVLRDDEYSFCKTIPGDAAGQHGGIPHLIVLDELHVLQNRDLLDVFSTGMSKKVRAQPLMVVITTSDHEGETPCNQEYAYAVQVRDNGGDPEKPGYDPSYFPVIYELKAGDDYTDESLWIRANPNIDVSVSRESLRGLVRKCRENPVFEGEVKRLHFNIRTKSAMQLISTQAWEGCGARPRTVEAAELVPPVTRPEELVGRVCYAGLDLSSSDDLTAATLAFPLEEDWLAVLSFSWCPRDRIVRRTGQKYPYDVWARNGYGVEGWPAYLTATDDDSIDHAFIRQAFVALGKVFSIKEIGYDPHGASEIRFNLIRDGFEVVPVTQSFRNLAAPTKELVRRVKTRRVIHFRNPVLTWAIGNAAAHIDGTIPPNAKLDEFLDKCPIMLSKRKSADKIDPAAALVLALARMGEDPKAGQSTASVYETRGVRQL